MTRTGLYLALLAAILAASIFALAPQLDLRAAALFFDSARGVFWAASVPAASWLRDASMWIVALLAAPAVVSLVMKIARPHARPVMPNRAAVFLIATLLLGPGLLVNVGLKDHWGRPRPSQVAELGGAQAFVAWWDPRGGCAKNCSFVAGEASGAFWTMSWAALLPPGAPRVLAYGGAIAFGLSVGALRMAFGAHFLSDVVFSGILIFLVIWLVHGALYRWRSAPSEESIDHALRRLRRSFTQRSRVQSPRAEGPR